MAKYQTGNTIYLEAMFFNRNNQLYNPDLVKIIFYDINQEEIKEVTLDESYKLSTGIYQYKYKVNNEDEFYEWYVEFDGEPDLKRKRISSSFI